VQQKPLQFGAEPTVARTPVKRPALTIAQLTERLRSTIEPDFADVWVEGEVSNLTIAGSGHWYFSLKDEHAQIRAVVWKTSTRLVRFRPKDGAKVLARGAVRLYAPKGEYQLSIEVLEPLGKGSLQQAFEDLKERLSKEGLFEQSRKRRLPMLPRRIAVITSPTGAVIRDILRVLGRRYANLEVLIYPARVQGPEAAAEIMQGIRAVSAIPNVDVLILARGGGSLEDLWPFNEERVARALAASKIPTISAVGHETDFTIADFVADLRAATPSAAAEHVVQAKVELQARVSALEKHLAAALGVKLQRSRARIQALTVHRVFTAEQGRIRTYAQRVDDLALRAGLAVRRQQQRAHEALRRSHGRLEAFTLDRQLSDRRQRLARAEVGLRARFSALQETRRARLARTLARLDSLSPLAVLSRGYALAFREDGRLVRSPDEVEQGAALRVRLHGGTLTARVTGKEPL
jgi:exodeoxyribonuclease VII large subunit